MISMVGIVTGLAYVNVFYMVLENPQVMRAEKELSMNLIGFSFNNGIFCGGVFVLIMDNTFFKSEG